MDIFNTKKLDLLERRIAAFEEQQRTFQSDVEQVLVQREAAVAALAQAALDARQTSAVPFVEIVSDAYDPELGVQLQLDWNDAFVKELKSKGYVGHTDRDIVNKWLINMHQQLADQFDKSDRV